MYIHVYKKGEYQADPGGCKKSLPSVCTSDNPHPPGHIPTNNLLPEIVYLQAARACLCHVQVVM